MFLLFATTIVLKTLFDICANNMETKKNTRSCKYKQVFSVKKIAKWLTDSLLKNIQIQSKVSVFSGRI